MALDVYAIKPYRRFGLLQTCDKVDVFDLQHKLSRGDAVAFLNVELVYSANDFGAQHDFLLVGEKTGGEDRWANNSFRNTRHADFFLGRTEHRSVDKGQGNDGSQN